MKKRLFLALCLSAALLLSGCTLPALPPLGSLTSTTTTGGGGGGPDQPSGPVYDDDSQSYGYYYDQLSGNEKAIYRAIYKNARTATEIPFALQEPLVVATPEADGDTAHSTAISTAVKKIIQPAMDALAYDHPEIAWIAYGGENGSSFSISLKSRTEDGNKIAEIGNLTFSMRYKDGITSLDGVGAFEGQINAAVSEITSGLAESAGSRYEVLTAIQNALAERVAYDKEGGRAHEAAGALLDGRAVCDGYAKSVKILCDQMGIPCVIVAGAAVQSNSEEPHAWNYVQMEDGLWYAIDLTWNDEGESASTDYFLIGAQTAPSGRAPFIESHLPDGKFSAGDYSPFTFPILSAEAYQQ